MVEELPSRIHGPSGLPALIYLPGLHGDWTLISRFRAALAGRVRLIEFCYPRRLDWSLADHARAVIEQLTEQGVERGWLLGESFGSQVAWAIVELTEHHGEFMPKAFLPEGVILVGGFVRHCSRRGVRWARACSHGIPSGLINLVLAFYGRYARLRYRQFPETVASVAEFIARRAEAGDRSAMTHRYDLIVRNDLRPVARRVSLPVYGLSAMFDHLVPWPLVLPWLKRNCPGFRGKRIIWFATHNTLASAPKTSADQIVTWIIQS